MKCATTDNERIIKMIEETLIELLKKTTEVEDITLDTVVGGNIINSINYIKLIVAIENEFDIEIPDEYLDISKLNTVRDIALFVEMLVK